MLNVKPPPRCFDSRWQNIGIQVDQPTAVIPERMQIFLLTRTHVQFLQGQKDNPDWWHRGSLSTLHQHWSNVIPLQNVIPQKGEETRWPIDHNATFYWHADLCNRPHCITVLSARDPSYRQECAVQPDWARAKPQTTAIPSNSGKKFKNRETGLTHSFHLLKGFRLFWDECSRPFSYRVLKTKIPFAKRSFNEEFVRGMNVPSAYKLSCF